MCEHFSCLPLKCCIRGELALQRWLSINDCDRCEILAVRSTKKQYNLSAIYPDAFRPISQRGPLRIRAQNENQQNKLQNSPVWLRYRREGTIPSHQLRRAWQSRIANHFVHYVRRGFQHMSKSFHGARQDIHRTSEWISRVGKSFQACTMIRTSY